VYGSVFKRVLCGCVGACRCFVTAFYRFLTCIRLGIVRIYCPLSDILCGLIFDCLKGHVPAHILK
jgi:hypothetical protein